MRKVWCLLQDLRCQYPLRKMKRDKRTLVLSLPDQEEQSWERSPKVIQAIASVIRAGQPPHPIADSATDNQLLLKSEQHLRMYTLKPETLSLSMSQPWDYIAKLVCIGDSGTGKSSVSV